jgi:hypothetical protein
MARRVELGAGLAAAVLSVIALAMVLLTPLVPTTCAGPVVAGRCAAGAGYLTLLAAGARVDASVWLYVIAMLIASLGGAAGAALDGVRRGRTALVLLWIATAVALAGCASVAALGGALGLFYVPPVLALLIAVAAALRRRATPPAQGEDAPKRAVDSSPAGRLS